MEELIYHYKAFISHTDVDSYWAKKLHTKLNHYNIPSNIRKVHPDLPKNLRPVFWYKRDISDLHLKQTIRKELYNSEYLIVICSPESAKSQWVNEEVRIFKEEFGRDNKIIPFIVSGTANSDDAEKECFPELLRNLSIDEQIRGIDIRGEDGTEGAFINLVATMLHIRYDELYRRYLREKKKKIYIRLMAAVFFLLVSFFVCDYYFNTKYEYFLDYADCNGLPVGIMPIEKEQAKKEYRSYRFEFLQNKLRRVVYVDCNGNIQPLTFTEYKDRFPIQELLYENGEYVGIECKSHAGDFICRYNYSKDFNSVNISDDKNDLATSIIRSASSITNDEEKKAQQHFIENLLMSPVKIGRYEYIRDSLGFVSTVYYCRNPYQSKRTTDINGIAGIKYTRDSLHRVVSIEYIDLQGDAKANEYGVVSKHYQYDSNGHISVSEYIGVDGSLQYNELGWAKAVAEYNDNGYCVKETYYGHDGNICRSRTGESITKYEWNKLFVRVSYFDEKENPISIHGSASVPGGYHSSGFYFDSNGNLFKEEYYDLDNKLCFNSFHFAIRKYKFNNRRPVEESYWSPENEPCISNNSIHCQKQEYDNNGRVVSISCWGTDNKKIHSSTGFHSISFEYKQNKLCSVKTYNIIGMLAPSLVLTNAAIVDIEYEDGFPSAVRFKDSKGNLCLDEQRNMYNTMVPYRDWAICRIKNENGMNTEFSYYDINDKKMLYKNCFFKKVVEYNEFGKQCRISFYDTNNNLTKDENGVCIIEMEYDKEHQNLLSCTTFKDQKGELCNNYLGIAKMTQCYYPSGKLKGMSYFDKNNKAASYFGVHQYNYEYDYRGRPISVTAFGENNKPAIQEQEKCHKIEYTYAKSGWIAEIRKYDSSNRLLCRPFSAVTRFDYGTDYQIKKCEYLDNEYKLCNNPDAGNVAICLMDYDAQGRQISEKYFDENKKMTLNTRTGYAEFSIEYKNNNSRISSFRNSEGEFINVNNICRVVEIYSENSLPLFGRTDIITDEKKLELDQRILYEYDEAGNFVSHYKHNDMGIIEISKDNNIQTLYWFEDEYNSYLNKINHAEDSLMTLYFNL